MIFTNSLPLGWSYGKSNIFIKEHIINCFDGMKINLHPSLLPYYKGCFSSVWALINNEKETGITYHILTSDVDKGNILIQEKIKNVDNDLKEKYKKYKNDKSIFN